jgi:hypothetical protein
MSQLGFFARVTTGFCASVRNSFVAQRSIFCV